MFFVMSKILTFIISPLVWILLLLAYSVMAKAGGRKKGALISAFVLLVLFTNTVIFQKCMGTWEWSKGDIDEISQNYPYGVVLAGMAGYDDETRRVSFGRGTDRLLQALRLYKLGIVKKIIITGGSGSLVHQEDKEALFLKDYLLILGFPSDDILVESESRNTKESAQMTKALFFKDGDPRRSLLITSAFHMRRASGCFEKVGLSIDAYPTDYFTKSTPFNVADFIIPHEGNLLAWNTLIHETVGYIVYKAFGYL